MNEPTSPIPPSPAPQPSPSAASNGSVALGFGLTWAILVLGYVVVWLVTMAISNTSMSMPFFGNGITLLLLQAAPLIVLLTVMTRLSKRGRNKTVKGMGLGFASVIGVGLLLVAACFGLLVMWSGSQR